MRGHAETKKNEQKTEKNNEMHKNILRNLICTQNSGHIFMN